ncbi:hypothetical protein Tco_1488561, partial [Tanacetum coccineum]
VQSRQNPSSGILKKIDRVLGNIEFMSKFTNSHALFLPHMSSDHNPTILILPKMLRRKHKAFRFSNFIVDKPDFFKPVQNNWNNQVDGCCMYRLVKKLKALKIHLKQFSWQFGNIFEKVIEWREKLQEIQKKVDRSPHDANLKKQEAMILKEFNVARRDEEKLLMQKAKID